jgi:hypothetical protein
VPGIQVDGVNIDDLALFIGRHEDAVGTTRSADTIAKLSTSDTVPSVRSSRNPRSHRTGSHAKLRRRGNHRIGRRPVARRASKLMALILLASKRAIMLLRMDWHSSANRAFLW